VGEVGAHEGLDDLVVPPFPTEQVPQTLLDRGVVQGWHAPPFRRTRLSVIAGIGQNDTSASRQPRSGAATTGIPRHLKCWSAGLNATIDEHVPIRRLNA
jgi:hypothetical protein